ncbi:MAG: VanW family protein [Parcubacteria group bacterium]|nr:VanW family protein [Parcubacteria group bacterium]
MKEKIIKWTRNIWTYSFLSLGLLFILFGIGLITLSTYYSNKFYPRTKISDVSVSGKTYHVVKNDFYEELNNFNQEIVFVDNEFEKKIKPNNIGIEIYLDSTIDETFNYGRDLFTPYGLKDGIEILLFGKNLKINSVIRKENFNNFVRSELEPLGVTSSDINFEEKGSDYEITLEKQGKSLDKDSLLARVENRIEKMSNDPIKLDFVSLYSQMDQKHLKNVKNDIKNIVSSKFILEFEDKKWEINEDSLKDWIYFNLEDEEVEGGFYKKKISVDLDRKKVGAFIESLKGDVEIKPENARFQVNDEKIEVLTSSVVGRDLLVEASYNELVEKVKGSDRTLTLKTKEVGAEINQENIDRLGIKELVGSGESNFAGSPQNRIHNITNAIEKLNGTFIGPQETYSIVENIGEVNAEAGYLPELVIKENKTIPEYGGGLCQVSTTLFRAAIYSGFKITERQSHSYAVSYYEPHGLDSTIYIPHPDLQFINDTDHAVLLQAKIDGYKLTFEFYGTKDEREVAIEGPYYWDRKGDGSFKARFNQIVKMPNGIERKDEFKSFYDSPDKYH